MEAGTSQGGRITSYFSDHGTRDATITPTSSTVAVSLHRPPTIPTHHRREYQRLTNTWSCTQFFIRSSLPNIPQFDRAIFTTSIHPRPIFIEPNGCHVATVAFQGPHLRSGGANLISSKKRHTQEFFVERMHPPTGFGCPDEISYSRTFGLPAAARYCLSGDTAIRFTCC